MTCYEIVVDSERTINLITLEWLVMILKLILSEQLTYLVIYNLWKTCYDIVVDSKYTVDLIDNL